MFDDKRRNIEVQSSKLIEILVYHQSFSLFHILCCWWIDEWDLWVEIIDFKKETYNFKESLNECIESRKKDSYSLLEILKLRSIICKIVRPIVIVVVTDPGRKIRTNDYRQIGLSFRDDSIASSIKEEESRECQAFPYERRSKGLSISSTNFSNALHFFTSLHTSPIYRAISPPPPRPPVDLIHGPRSPEKGALFLGITN